ncbi:inactive leucine-rich repeat receptor-like protein kinase [Abeliophyllum distichum]|uniref:Inactive leucine-rich repeat receptor-like protein kinase n=1 Tax=Abeliophyllum distichum TaxID=126358 RepID=A0ABD1RE34_9LAMI
MKDDGEHMDWPLWLKIGIGAAKGLAWLHHSCNPHIIHRNISSSCILLDLHYEPKISDSGLASLMNPIGAHLGTFVNGKFGDMGYVPPEYLRTLLATPKGDVYSFGVVLLELVTGYDGELSEFLTVACSCVLTDPNERPTMFEVYQFLRAIGRKV